MRNDTRTMFNGFMRRVAELNGVDSVINTFSVDPTVQQRLETAMQESSEFLQRINMVGVDELMGEKVGLDVSGTVAGRTDTSAAGERTPRDVAALDQDGYLLSHTDFDTYIRYQTIDAWAKFPDFQARLANLILQRQAQDRIRIGFHGTSIAATTDRTANPNLEDVNIGWMQKYRTNAPARVMNTGKTAGKVLIGPGAANDYKNLDALVYDAIQLIEPWYQRNKDLVVITGRELVHDKYFPIVNKDQPATEVLASDLIISQRRAGGLPLYEVPFIPEGALMITAFANLSLYWQTGGRRRHIVEEPKKNRIANYESSNEGYVVEDYGFGCIVENIEISEE